MVTQAAKVTAADRGDSEGVAAMAGLRPARVVTVIICTELKAESCHSNSFSSFKKFWEVNFKSNNKNSA